MQLRVPIRLQQRLVYLSTSLLVVRRHRLRLFLFRKKLLYISKYQTHYCMLSVKSHYLSYWSKD